MSKRLEDLIQYQQILLSQKLSMQRGYLKDYALNTKFKELARLRVISRFLGFSNRKFVRELERILLELGESEGIQGLDVVSQLGVKVGYTRRKIEL